MGARILLPSCVTVQLISGKSQVQFPLGASGFLFVFLAAPPAAAAADSAAAFVAAAAAAVAAAVALLLLLSLVCYCSCMAGCFLVLGSDRKAAAALRFLLGVAILGRKAEWPATTAPLTKNTHSETRFRSWDLWVMSPTR